MVDETFEGDKRDEGYVTTESEFRIELSRTEAQQMKFWRYHANENDASKPAWGSLLHRYFNDEQAAIILRDIAAIKQGTKSADLAQRFYQHFCKVKEVEINSLSMPNGALTRQL
mgnify:CR=1 FL=1